MFDLLAMLIVDPLLDLLARRTYSGRWHFSYLPPILTGVSLIVCWLGNRYDLELLTILGIVGAVIFGMVNLLLFIPREVESWRDFQSYMAQRPRKAKASKKQKAADHGEKREDENRRNDE